jgi:PAS domain S-box-containing protein
MPPFVPPQELAVIIDSIPAGVYIGDSDGIRLCNRIGLEMLGYASVEEMNSPISALADRIQTRWPETGERVPPDEDPFIRALTGEACTREVSFTNIRTGHTYVVECKAVPLLEDGKVVGALALNTDVTERWQRERETAQRERDFVALVENTPDVISRFAPDLRHLYINPAVERLSGNAPGFYLGKTNRELGTLNEPMITRWEEALRRVFTTGQPDIFEATTPHADGSTRHSQARIVPELEDGKVTSVLTVSRDTTERDRAIEALQKSLEALGRSEEKLRRFLSSSVIGILQGHLDGSVYEANDELLRMVGHTRADLEAGAVRWPDYTAPEYHERDQAAVAEAKIKGGCTPYEKEYLHADGTRVPVLIGFVLVGEAREETIAFVLDLTALKLTEARARRVIDAGIVGIINWNLDTSLITDANDVFLTMTGYTRDDLAAGRMNFREMTPPEWKTRNEAEFAAVRRDRTTTAYEKEYYRKDGSRVPVLLGDALFDDSENEGVSFVLDISERKRLENELADAWEKQSRIAETMQRSLLISSDPGDFRDLDVAMHFEPAWDDALIGGDFFDAFPLRDGSTALVVGDVTGKGLAAAAYTAEVKFALRAFLREDSNPAVAMGRLNRFLVDAQTLDKRDNTALVCMVIAIVQGSTGRLQVSAAGAEPPLLIRAEAQTPSDTEEIWSHGLILGIERDAEYEATERTLEQGDLLVLTTDGVTEARRMGATGTVAIFGYDGLRDTALEALTAIRPLSGNKKFPPGGMDVLAETIADSAKKFSNNVLQDDVCLLIARRR